MIISRKPEIGLQPHQQEAYAAISATYKNGNKKAAVVLPTGCGKSFVALQLMADNPNSRILFLAPTRAIRNQMYKYIAKYIVGETPTKERPAKMIAEEHFPNLKIMLYPSLLRVNKELMKKINADIIIMDELHRTGAEKWGEKINDLLEENPNAKLLGITATPERADDINVIDKLFEGGVDYELTLVQALKRRIVKSPQYVKCDYALGEYLEGIKKAIENCQDEKKKKSLQEKYDKMRKIVEHADGIPELFKKHLEKKDGKYIVFCKDKAHMEDLMAQAKEWFKYIDEEPEIYSVFSGEGYTDKANKETIENFENSTSEHIKLLFSVEMLNEGLHVEDISGVIMARPTESRIIYLQQLGRALSSDPDKEPTIVLDLVNNYLKNNLDAELNERELDKPRQDRETGEKQTDNADDFREDEIDIFRIQGETQEFLELLEEIQGTINENAYLINARAIKEWIEKSGDTKPPSSESKNKEEKRLGKALATIRQRVIKPYLNLETDEEREKYRKEKTWMDEVLEIVHEIDENNISQYLKNARGIKEWIEKSGDTKPPSSKSKDEEEKRLGTALGGIRRIIKSFMELETEEREQFRRDKPWIDEVLEIIQEIDENNINPYLKNARAIKEWIEKSGDKKPPSQKSKDDEEKRLSNALHSIRNCVIKPFMELKTEEEREKYRQEKPWIDEVISIIQEIDENSIPQSLKNARLIKEWMEKSGDTKPPSSRSKDNEEKRLAKLLDSIRQRVIKPYLNLETKEEREKYRQEKPWIDEVISIIQEIDENNIPQILRNARAIKEWIEKSGDKKTPSQYSKDEKEKRLSKALSFIKGNIIKQFMALETEEEREKYRQEKPWIDEVLEIVHEIDENNINQNLINARAIKEWIEKLEDKKLPSKNSKDDEEKRLGCALGAIRTLVITTFMKLATEEEREKYRQEKPWIDEVLEIISEIELQYGTKNRKALALLIREDIKKRQALKEAQELEKQFEEQIEAKEEHTPPQGVDIDE